MEKKFPRLCIYHLSDRKDCGYPKCKELKKLMDCFNDTMYISNESKSDGNSKSTSTKPKKDEKKDESNPSGQRAKSKTTTGGDLEVLDEVDYVGDYGKVNEEDSDYSLFTSYPKPRTDE